MSKRVLIISVYVDSVDKHIPVIIAIEKRGYRLAATATRFGWTNKLIESLETKQDLSSDEYKLIQEELIFEIKRRVSLMSSEEFQIFSDEESPTKVGIALNVEKWRKE